MLEYNRDNKLSLFGVFDGHGGKEVAFFTKQHLGDCIKQSDNFK
jgi:serine/threonine protein phosphatase PrpC